jgi:hypothetical protein
MRPAAKPLVPAEVAELADTPSATRQRLDTFFDLCVPGIPSTALTSGVGASKLWPREVLTAAGHCLL